MGKKLSKNTWQQNFFDNKKKHPNVLSVCNLKISNYTVWCIWICLYLTWEIPLSGILNVDVTHRHVYLNYTPTDIMYTEKIILSMESGSLSGNNYTELWKWTCQVRKFWAKKIVRLLFWMFFSETESWSFCGHFRMWGIIQSCCSSVEVFAGEILLGQVLHCFFMHPSPDGMYYGMVLFSVC